MFKMKNLLPCLLTCALMFLRPAAFAQLDTKAPYQQEGRLPSFSLELVNGKNFSSTSLKKNIPTLIMFFSPTCDHCIDQFESMIKQQHQLKGIQIVMATIQPKEELDEFIRKYKLANYPNYTAGRDAEFFFPPYYRIRNFPFLAFYDRQGKLISSYEGNMSVADILQKFS